MIDETLKPLHFRDRDLFYKLRKTSAFEEIDYVTDFYLTNDVTKFRKKYYLWGPIIETFDNEYSFTLNFDIENGINSKKRVIEGLNPQVDLLDRCEEIERGNIV